jgi:hypothetical protein
MGLFFFTTLIFVHNISWHVIKKALFGSRGKGVHRDNNGNEKIILLKLR